MKKRAKQVGMRVFHGEIMLYRVHSGEYTCAWCGKRLAYGMLFTRHFLPNDGADSSPACLDCKIIELEEGDIDVAHYTSTPGTRPGGQ